MSRSTAFAARLRGALSAILIGKPRSPISNGWFVRLASVSVHVSTLLREGAIDMEEAATLLDNVRHEMGDVARQLPPERESAGSR